MPTCTQITDALNVLASATSDPNIIADLSSQLVPLVNSTGYGTAQIVQLTTGGDAILTIPPSISIEGKRVKIIVSGKVNLVSTDPDKQVYINVCLGDVANTNAIATWYPNFGSIVDNMSFSFSIEGVWNLATGKMAFNADQSVGTASNMLNPVANCIYTAASQTDIKFTVSGQIPGTTHPNTITINQFEMKFS